MPDPEQLQEYFVKMGYSPSQIKKFQVNITASGGAGQNNEIQAYIIDSRFQNTPVGHSNGSREVVQEEINDGGLEHLEQ